MRVAVLLGMAGLLACSTKEAPPAADTAATLPPGKSLGAIAAIWDVNVMALDKDSVLTTYLLNTTDTAGWMFAFPNQQPVKMHVTNRMGDTLVAETDLFDSSVRPGLKARSVSTMAFVANAMSGKVVAHYQTTGADSVMTFRIEGTRR